MEFVYVVKRYDLFDLSFPHGFQTGQDEGALSNYVERITQKGFFIERRFCEKDSSFKQIIPYAVIVHEDRVLLLRRTTSQGEARLHNKQSIGVGGHINPVDGDAKGILINGCRREIEEELIVDEPYDPIPMGIINDESNDVGSVHFGMVYRVKLAEGRVDVREKSMMTAEFVETHTLKEMIVREDTNFETWSSLIIEAFHTMPL
jgi:predicted NUDIX family phosphoesterase